MTNAPAAKPQPPTWFDPINRGTPRLFTVSHLFDRRREQAEDFEAFTAMNVPGQTWLCGFVIPPFQRPVVWDEDRMARFVESAASGVNLGEWTYVDASNAPDTVHEGKRLVNRTDRWLIDGQQRITALDRFWSDAFPVRGASGASLYWSEVPKVEKRRFLNQVFQAKELYIADEAALRRYYDLHNFGGVVHTQDQRAAPREVDAPVTGPR